MWQDFGESNSIRFCVEHNWQVNFYSRKEFNKMLNKLGMKIVLVATITNDNNKINYLYVIKV